MSGTYVSIAAATVLSAGFAAAALFHPDGVGRHRDLEADLDAVRAKNRDIRAENERLVIERDALRHDEAYIEAVIRDDLGYVGEDEVVLQLDRAKAP